MQDIQLLTREDIADVVEHVLREQFHALRSELIESFNASFLETLREGLPGIVEAAVHERLESLQREVLTALEEAVRKVTQETSPSTPDDLGDDFHQ